jgi:hypothetical protein
MKTPFPRTLNHWLRSFGFLAALFCFAPGLYASPVIFPGRSQNSVLAVYVAVAIFLEAVCVAWLLRKFHRPRFFILWVLGTHLLTFPAFLGFIWLLQSLFRDFTITLAEGLVVLAEGWLLHQICRRTTSPFHSPVPSAGECLFVALIGNAFSLAAFWLLLVPFSALFR